MRSAPSRRLLGPLVAAAIVGTSLLSVSPAHAITENPRDTPFSAEVSRVDYDEADVTFTGHAGWKIDSYPTVPPGADSKIGPDGTVTITYPIEDYQVYYGRATLSDPSDPDAPIENASMFIDADLTSPIAPRGVQVTPGSEPDTVTVTATARVAGFIEIRDAELRLRGSAVIPTNGSVTGDNSVSVMARSMGGEHLTARFRYGAFSSSPVALAVGEFAGAAGTTPPSASATDTSASTRIDIDGTAGATAFVQNALGSVVAQARLTAGHASVVLPPTTSRATYRLTQTTEAGRSEATTVTAHPELQPADPPAPTVDFTYLPKEDAYHITVTALPGSITRIDGPRASFVGTKIVGARGSTEFVIPRPHGFGEFRVSQQLGSIISPGTAVYL